AGATRREQRHVEALSAVIGGDTARGLELIEEHVAEFPRDALLVNQASSSIGFGGRVDREEFRLAQLERLAPAYGEDWWFQSALAFAYHEVCGDEGRERWQPIAVLAARVSRPGFVFGDIHAAIAYAATGDGAGLAGVVDGLTALAARGHPIAGAVALPLVRGAAAFAAGDFAEALAHLEPVDGEIHR